MTDNNTEVFITPEQLAARWQMSKDTLANWRIKKHGPSYTKIGAGRNTKVLYKIADIIEFESQHVKRSE